MRALSKHAIIAAAIASTSAMIFASSSTNVSAVSTPAITGKCAFMLTTLTFALQTNSSENEVSSIGIFDFDNSTWSGVNAEISRQSGSITRQPPDLNRRFYLWDDVIPGMKKMTFSQDANSADHVILVPSNSNNTILIMDPRMGATGVCQKL